MVESQAYDVLRTEGLLEVRRYPLMMLATVRDMSDDDAFSILFRYISGDNSKREKVSMTAPVVSRGTGSERIPMTVPVVSGKKSFSFVLPSDYSPSDVPEPGDPRIDIEVLPGRDRRCPQIPRPRCRTGGRRPL